MRCENRKTNRNTTSDTVWGVLVAATCNTHQQTGSSECSARADNDLEHREAMQIFLFVSCHDLQDFCVHGIACIEHTIPSRPAKEIHMNGPI